MISQMKRFLTVLSVDGNIADQSRLQDAVIRTETPFHIQPFFSPHRVISYLLGEPPFDNRKIYPYPALILCDDGLKSIRAISSSAGLPIITLGNSEGHDSISQCYEAGIGHFLHKPSSPGGLDNLIQSLSACATSGPLVSTASVH